MSGDPLDRLRATNPAPNGSTAPPVERVLERIRAQDAGERAGGRGSRAWSGALLPALGVAAAIAVVVVAVVALHHRGGVTRRPAPTAPSAPHISVPLLPRGGTRGTVFLNDIAFSSPERGIISMEQCLPCQAGPGHASWLASTNDGGVTWRVARASWESQQQDIAFSGADGWSEGIRANGSGGGFLRFFVTHNAGRTWAAASSAAAAASYGGVTIAGGEVWSLGSSCGLHGCPDTVLHAPASGSRFTAAAVQLPLDDDTNVDVVAAGPGTAYVASSDRSLIFATHDNGASWKRLTPPCPRADFGRLSAGGPSSLWDTCEPRHGATLVSRSVDGGRHWRRLPIPFNAVFGVQPASSLIAWALTTHGQVLRTTDGGQSWVTVWSSPRSEPPGQAGASPLLTTQSATSADVVVEVTRGHPSRTNLVVYRTSDGGTHWRGSVVALPRR
jgi:photosystem II stability/assembly factor-like uncharacterized protein